MATVHYPAIIERAGTGYSVYFPDLPGCTSAGGTIQEAAKNAEEALAGHLLVSQENGDEIADPSDLDTIERDPDVDEIARLLVRGITGGRRERPRAGKGAAGRVAGSRDQALPDLDEFLGSIPLFAGLDPSAIANVRLAADRFSLAAGERMFAQDEAADSLYLVASGSIGLTARTPGDGLVELSRVGAGGVIGEFCLLDGGRRSAEARALAPTLGFRIDLSRFGALRASAQPAAFEILDRVRGEVARRTRAAVEDIVQAIGKNGMSRSARALAVPPCSDACDCSALLATFPGFDTFDDGLWRELGGLVTRIAAARGTRLETPGERASGLHIVARGALRTGHHRAAGVEQLLIHGPGAIAGAAALVYRGEWPMGIDVREDAVLFTLARRDFATLRAAHSPLAHRLLDIVGQQLVRDLRRLSRVRSRVESLDAVSKEAG